MTLGNEYDEVDDIADDERFLACFQNSKIINPRKDLSRNLSLLHEELEEFLTLPSLTLKKEQRNQKELTT